MSKRILQFFAILNNGGAENRMMDVYRCINPNVVTFDFAVVYEGEHFFDEEIYSRGSRKYYLSNPHHNLIKNYWELVQFFREHREYDVVHAHVAWYSGIVLLAAKHAGVPIRIAHARDSVSPYRSWKEKCIADIGKLLISLTATSRLAISEEAAENVFGKRAVQKKAYRYIPNAIDQKKYRILEGEERTRIRQELGIPEDKKAYVTVASIRKQKNHVFLMDIVKALKDKEDNFILYLVGDGVLRKQVEEKVARLGISENVVFMGNRGDVSQILGAFDGMIFPSNFEGLGGVILEAQLVGVPCVVSDNIPRAVDVGVGMVDYVLLSETPETWAEIIIKKFSAFHWEKEKTLQAFMDKGYCIENTTQAYLKEYGLDDETIREAMGEAVSK